MVSVFFPMTIFSLPVTLFFRSARDKKPQILPVKFDKLPETKKHKNFPWKSKSGHDNFCNFAKPLVSYFFLPVKVHFFHILGKNRLNEKAAFFFPATEKKYSFEIDWMNDMWTFTGKKKTHKKHPKMLEKKKHKQLSKKINKNPPNPEWMAHELFLGKKKIHPCIFFFRFAEKKKYTILRFDWMNGPWTFSEKKNTIPLSRVKLHNFNFWKKSRFHWVAFFTGNFFLYDIKIS